MSTRPDPKTILASPAEPATPRLAVNANGLSTRRIGLAGHPLILTYHEIVPQPSPYLYAVTCERFEEHLRVGASWLAEAERETHHPQITFDDGHLSNYHFAYPLLEKYSQRATFFVIAGWIGNRPEYMSWQQLRELVAAGHEVRSHCWSHVLLTRCSDADLADELGRSKRTLEDRLGVPVDSMSAPHGRWNRRVLEYAAQAGYARVYISNPWIATRKRGGVEVHGRLMVKRTHDGPELQRLRTLDASSRFLLHSRYQAKELVRLALGDQMYHRLWSRLAGWVR